MLTLANHCDLPLHGVLMQIEHRGVLILGESGSGKSDLALSLLERQHRIVADDSVCLYRHHDSLYGRAQLVGESKMEIRGLGIQAIHDLFGPKATLDHCAIHWQLSLKQHADPKLYQNEDRHRGNWGHTLWLDVPLPTLTLSNAPNRPLALIVELANRMMPKYTEYVASK